MCGLIGSRSWHGDVSPLGLDQLRHRGPDSRGTWTSPDRSCWFGHTRLAIQDLTPSGHQPMTSHCGQVTLIFNGEIYNHLEIRDSIDFNQWRGHSDSETIVEGLAQFGYAFIEKLRGMFAIAAFDLRSGQLLLVRDRLGIKPLYISCFKQKVFFASERHVLPSGRDVSAQTISQVLAFGHDSTPIDFDIDQSQGVRSLPPGVSVLFDADGPAYPSRFWPPQSSDGSPTPSITSRGQARSLLRQCLDDVVARHLAADLPVACFLSSGLDSGILAALACRQQPGGVDTFTVALPGLSDDEGSHARLMAIHCGSRHHELALTGAEAIDLVEQALEILDVPTADALNTFLISNAVASHGFRVALSGLGADELFGGYPSHRLVGFLSRFGWIPESMRRRLLRWTVPRLARKLEGLPRWDVWHLSLAVRRWVGDSELHAASALPLQWPRQFFPSIRDSWAMISCAELYGYTEPMLLRDSDVMSMACSLELRVPYLDHCFVELALSIPQRFHQPGKGLLRDAFHDLFPSGYLQRSKQGFLLPMRLWMQGPLRRLCLERLDALMESRWLDSHWIRLQWHLFETDVLTWPRAWTLVVLGEFARRQRQASGR